MTKRRAFITPQQEQVNEEWKTLVTRQFNDDELEEFHIRLERWNWLGTREDLERFYIDCHAAVRQYPPYKGISFLMDPKNPGTLSKERVDNKIDQWAEWRKKKYGTVQRISRLEKMAALHAADPLASEFDD